MSYRGGLSRRLSCLVVTTPRRFFWCNAVVRSLNSGDVIFSVLNWNSRRPSTKPKHSATSDALLAEGVPVHHVAILYWLICGQHAMSKFIEEFD